MKQAAEIQSACQNPVIFKPAYNFGVSRSIPYHQRHHRMIAGNRLKTQIDRSGTFTGI